MHPVRFPSLRWPALPDIAMAVALGGYAALAGLTSNEYPNPGVVTASLSGLAGVAVAWRRVAPTVAFVVSMASMSLVCLLYGTFQAGSSLLIALVASYSALAHSVRPPVFAAVIAAFAVANSSGPLPDRLGGAAFVLVSTGLAGAGGLLARRLREMTAANIALRELVELHAGATTSAAVADERSRVAHELHDILSHSLGVVVLQTSAAEHAWQADPVRAREALHAARETAVEAVEQLRTLLGVVRDGPEGERSPVRGLSDIAALATRTRAGGFNVELEEIGIPRAVRPEVQASVYRVAQEGVANAIKHSGTRGCHIRLDYRSDCVVVQVDDQGRSRPAGSGSRMGLEGIRERAAVFGGRVAAGPRPTGDGWRLEVAFPA
jgi:signal transduction histidine kinase